MNKIINKQLVLVEFKNHDPYIYEITSEKEITHNRVVNYLKERNMKAWEEELNRITFIDEAIKLFM